MDRPAMATRRLAAGAALAGLAAVVLAACGSTPAAAPARTTTRTVTVTATPAPDPSSASARPAPTRTADGPPVCLASGLQAQLGGANAAAGTTYQTVSFTNTSPARCGLDGFPGVSFVTGPGGHQIGAPATRSHVLAPVLVTLAPGQAAHVTLGVAVAGNFPAGQCQPVTADWLKIYPPGDYGSLYIRFHTPACARSSLSILSVTAVRAGSQ